MGQISFFILVVFKSARFSLLGLIWLLSLERLTSKDCIWLFSRVCFSFSKLHFQLFTRRWPVDIYFGALGLVPDRVPFESVEMTTSSHHILILLRITLRVQINARRHHIAIFGTFWGHYHIKSIVLILKTLQLLCVEVGLSASVAHRTTIVVRMHKATPTHFVMIKLLFKLVEQTLLTLAKIAFRFCFCVLALSYLITGSWRLRQQRCYPITVLLDCNVTC